MRLLLKNGRVVDPAARVDDALDVLVEDGTVARVEPKIPARGAEVIDLAGLVVCPGFIDIHVHLREPGQEWKETVATGTRGGRGRRVHRRGLHAQHRSRRTTAGRSREFILAQAAAVGGRVACTRSGA